MDLQECKIMIFEHNIEYLLAFISAIFGLSVPIMLQVIERVDSRYESTRLAERLKSEGIIKTCIVLLIVALVTSAYAMFCQFPSPWDCWIMNNSADLIAFITCAALIVGFLFACRVILIYYNPEKLQDRILEYYAKAKKADEKERNFLDWVDLTKSLMGASDRTPAFKVYDTIGKEIYGALDKANEGGLVLPSYVVRGITSINENLCLMPRRPFSINNGNQILKNLISQPEKLSDDAYRLIWNNLQLQLFYDQEDWVYEYWSAAVQVYDHQLARLYEGTPSFDNPDVVIAAEDVNKRNAQRKRFKEFHITLCASVLREKRYDLLEKLIDYFYAMTPEYEYPLVPSSVSEIQEAFQMINESPRLDFGAEGYYPMRGMKGIVDGIIMGSVKRYLTLLYVRVFSNIGRMKSTYVNYPITIGGLKRLDEDVDYLQRTLPSVLDNKDLMNILSFEDSSKAKGEMWAVLKDIKDGIVVKEKDIKKNKPNAADIVEENLSDVKELVERKLGDYSQFVRTPKKNEDLKTFYLRGVSSYLFPNEAFQHDAGISYVNMAGSVAGASLSNIQHGIASVFYQKEQKLFRINNEEIFASLDRLKLDGEYTIVAFDIYLEYYLHKNVKGFVKEKGNYSYNGIQIFCLHGGPSELVTQKLFVMKKTDMPSLSYIAPNEGNINKYELKLLSEDYNLYGSVVKLSENEILLKGVDNLSEDEALNYSLFNVFVNAKMAWEQAAPVVCIKLMYDLKDNGTSDALDSVKPFEELFGEKENDASEN